MNELTVEILKQIRDGVGHVGQRIDHLGERVGQLKARVTKLEKRRGS